MLDGLKRGSIVIGSGQGPYGKKPRPMLVVQSTRYVGQVDSVTVAPITSFDGVATMFRVRVDATEENGLDRDSVICADKLQSVRLDNLRDVTGQAPEPVMRSVDEAVRRWLDL